MHILFLNSDFFFHFQLTTDYIRNVDRETHNLILPYSIKNASQIIKQEPSDQHDNNINNITNVDNVDDEIDRTVNLNSIKLEQDDFDINSDEMPLLIEMKKSKKRKRKHENSIDMDNVTIKDENNIGDISDVPLEFDNLDSSIDDDNFDKAGDIEMIVLTKEQQIEEVLCRKNSLNYKNSVFKCDKCFKGFMTDVTYRKHMVRHDPVSFSHFTTIP